MSILTNSAFFAHKDGSSRRGRRLLLGLLLSSGIGLLAYRRKSLTRSGVAGAIVTGTTTFGLGGWSWGLALIFFFVSSSLLSRWREKEKERTAADKFSKGTQRDLGQAAANGGVATLLALGYGMGSASSPLSETLEAGYAGALAAATADTWATELGVLSAHKPRLITTGRPTEPGTSGGITLLGTSAATLGALALGLVFWLLQGCRRASRHLPLVALVGGLTGSLFDSLLGATVQVMYYCPNCDKETERRIHSCGTATRQQRGLSWVNNDLVNFLATLFGSIVAMVASLPFRSQRAGRSERWMKNSGA
ncbi:MAG: DUF92 domain-containing protein [Ktedonobacteraceae bacterium]|nr:DUF92 domain-containing protein [Ktedonobacteraceae bacterium]MBO0795560.1 DUF92 domain-containing protein [Ktedonobacteraceae bacterium]